MNQPLAERQEEMRLRFKPRRKPAPRRRTYVSLCVGDRFGDLEVTGPETRTEERAVIVPTVCKRVIEGRECGNSRIIRRSELLAAPHKVWSCVSCARTRVAAMQTVVEAPRTEPPAKVLPFVARCNGLCRPAGNGCMFVSPQCPRHYGYGVVADVDPRDRPGESSLAQARAWAEA